MGAPIHIEEDVAAVRRDTGVSLATEIGRNIQAIIFYKLISFDRNFGKVGLSIDVPR